MRGGTVRQNGGAGTPMNGIVVKAAFQRPRGLHGAGGEVITAHHRFRRVRSFWRRSCALVSFLVLCPLLLFGSGSSLRIVDSSAGSRGIVARERQP
jgi:hypothetical protein